jgi:hypothetical protein
MSDAALAFAYADCGVPAGPAPPPLENVTVDPTIAVMYEPGGIPSPPLPSDASFVAHRWTEIERRHPLATEPLRRTREGTGRLARRSCIRLRGIWRRARSARAQSHHIGLSAKPSWRWGLVTSPR